MKTTKNQRTAMREMGIIPPGWRVLLLDDVDDTERELERLRALARGLVTSWREATKLPHDTRANELLCCALELEEALELQ